MRVSHLAIAALMIAGTHVLAAEAFAQAPPSPSTPGQRTAPPNIARTNCAPTEAVPQDGTLAPKGTTTGQSNGTSLSDRLAQSDGVLCPPAGVDPEMHAPAPGGGRTPVIPPPGSPGGDPTQRPK